MDSESDNTSNNASVDSEIWHIIQRAEGHCDIEEGELNQLKNKTQSWGPFSSQTEAIAKRVGLIRSGKCLPK
ncbi:MAG: DDE transposase family protein [Cyanobacteria bacterium P01_D01_bin.56]